MSTAAKTAGWLGGGIFLVACLVQAQPSIEPAFLEEHQFRCDRPAESGNPLGIAVRRYWTSGNALTADIEVHNRSSHPVVVAARNADGQYWSAELFDSTGTPIQYCGGVRNIDWDEPAVDLPHSEDLVTIDPGATVVLPSVYLAPFWWYLWDEHPAAFRVYYQSLEFNATVISKYAAQLAPFLRAAESLHCALYPCQTESTTVCLNGSSSVCD
jgi:hypothetical protein